MALSDVDDPAELVYRVNFHTSLLDPNHVDVRVNPFNLGLTAGTSGLPDENPSPAVGPLVDASGKISDPSVVRAEGLALSIARTQDPAGKPTALICSLSPIPKSMLRFQISADFQLADSLRDPVGNESPGNMWAISVVAHNGVTLNPPAPGPNLVAATHQVRVPSPLKDPPIFITLGSPDTPKRSPKPGDVAVPARDALESGAFTLRAYFDCQFGVGQSSLSTDAGFYWESTWTHPFTPVVDPSTAIACAGFGVGMSKGTGRPGVFVKEFRVLNWVHRFPPPPRPPTGLSK
jgi:hypothetical protein